MLTKAAVKVGLAVLAVVLVVTSVIVYFVTKGSSSTDDSRNTNSVGSRVTSTLQFVIVVNRHGNRGLYFSYPTDPYSINNTNIWPFGPAQLTSRGRVQMYNLGAKIRSLYNGFLAEFYYSKNFKAFSTLMDRTLQSGLMFLAGLFPPRGFEVWDGNILWQPIPIYPGNLDKTAIIAPAVSAVECPVFNVAQNQSITEFNRTYGSDVTALLESMQPYTGFTVEPQLNIMQLITLWDSLLCEDSEGLPLPTWTKKFYPEPMKEFARKLYTAFTIGSDTMIKYLQGKLFQEMVGLLRSKSSGTLPDGRMYYYSGHDQTLMGLLGILNQGDAGVDIVKTGSALIYELHKNETNYFYIQVLYIDGGSADLEPTPITVPGCDYPCGLDHFLNLTEKYYNITDYSAECQIV